MSDSDGTVSLECDPSDHANDDTDSLLIVAGTSGLSTSNDAMPDCVHDGTKIQGNEKKRKTELPATNLRPHKLKKQKTPVLPVSACNLKARDVDKFFAFVSKAFDLGLNLDFAKADDILPELLHFAVGLNEYELCPYVTDADLGLQKVIKQAEEDKSELHEHQIFKMLDFFYQNGNLSIPEDNFAQCQQAEDLLTSTTGSGFFYRLVALGKKWQREKEVADKCKKSSSSSDKAADTEKGIEHDNLKSLIGFMGLLLGYYYLTNGELRFQMKVKAEKGAEVSRAGGPLVQSLETTAIADSILVNVSGISASIYKREEILKTLPVLVAEVTEAAKDTSSRNRRSAGSGLSDTEKQARKASREKFRSVYITNKFHGQHPVQLIGALERFFKSGNAKIYSPSVDVSLDDPTCLYNENTDLYIVLGLQLVKDEVWLTKVVADNTYLSSLNTEHSKRKGRAEYQYISEPLSLKKEAHMLAFVMYLQAIRTKFPTCYTIRRNKAVS